jgi:16S rRNA (uracil1498-N3)-methyltransferase
MTVFYYENLLSTTEIILPEDEAKHCLKVLRMKVGDFLHLTDGKGNIAEVIIRADNLKKCIVEVKNIQYEAKKHTHRIHIAIAPTKNTDRMEWFVEKCVEIGIDEISFLQTEHSERSYFNGERMAKKAIAAMKQSLNFHLPILHEQISIQKFFANIAAQNKIATSNQAKTELFIAYVDKENPTNLFQAASKNSSYCVLIGPEGDFSKAELAQAISLGFQCVSLGNSRLRTETAGIVACHTLQLLQS